MVRQEKGNTDGFLAMLKNILLRYQRVLIELWVDQARWHKGKRVTEFLSYHSRLIINYIPKYHPELNPQEMLWRTMRYEETTGNSGLTLCDGSGCLLEKQDYSMTRN